MSSLQQRETPVSENEKTGTLGKLMEVLDAVAAAPHPVRFSELLAILAQPRGTLHRHLAHLLSEGLLETDRQGRYRLGIRLLRLASQSWSRNDIRLICEPHLSRLNLLTGETIHLAALRDTAVIYLDKVDGSRTMRMHSQIGNASPVYCTGVGKAALSVLPEDALSGLLSRLTFQRFTMHTKDMSALMLELRQIRSCGYALDLQEHEEGIACIAAPVCADGHNFVGAVSVTGPAYRLTKERLEGWAPDIKAVAHAIADDLRLRLGPRR